MLLQYMLLTNGQFQAVTMKLHNRTLPTLTRKEHLSLFLAAIPKSKTCDLPIRIAIYLFPGTFHQLVTNTLTSLRTQLPISQTSPHFL